MTFVEILFAILILGVGFIMIAAIFPVALQQTQSSIDETTAADLARSAVSTLSAIKFTAMGLSPTTCPSGQLAPMFSLHDADQTLTLWRAIRGSVISTADPRYAWVAFYSWPSGSQFAKFVIITTRVRNRPSYDEYHDVVRYSNGIVADTASSSPATLEGQSVSFTITPGTPAGTYQVSFASAEPAAMPLAYLVVSSDTTNTANGFVFRLGNLVPGSSSATWQLIPGDDLSGLTGALASGVTGTGYIVGRGLTDPTEPTTSGYDGPAQDVAAYTTFITMN
jgi:hypothetical protein